MRRRSGSSVPVSGRRSAFPVAGKAGALSAFLTAAGIVLIVLAVVIGLYPGVSACWGAYRAQQQFSLARDTASQYAPDDVDALIAAAQDYNARISGADASLVVDPYERQLVYDEAGVLCWLDIPKLGITLPVYRDDGTDGVPPEGAEHVLGTSLPVGGVPSNTVITAHSGSHQGTPMAFNKLEQLQNGDSVVLWTLGRPFAYEVTGSEVIEPDEAGTRLLARGGDELTLLTCRPIGTTAQRLLVHAARVDYAADEDGLRVRVVTTSEWFVVAVVLLAVGAFALALFLRVRWWHVRNRRMRGDDDVQSCR